jgi:hypothetical protein
MSDLTDALEAWRDSVRQLNATTPWTPRWLRARLVEEDRRFAFRAMLRQWPEEEARRSSAAEGGLEVGDPASLSVVHGD